jgi:hypothetical protein
VGLDQLAASPLSRWGAKSTRTVSGRRQANCPKRATASTCRVRGWRCRHPLPSEPDVKVSPSSGSSRCKAPHERSRFTRGQSRHLDDTDLGPSGLWRILKPITVGEPPRVGGCTRGALRVHLLFPPAKVLAAFSSRSTHWKSARFRGGVITPLLSARLQEGICFFQHPLSALPAALLAESPASTRREDGFTMFRSTSIGWVSPNAIRD